jgi:long-chain acyl-CoA synthetase
MSKILKALHARPHDEVIIESVNSSLSAGQLLADIAKLGELLKSSGIDRLGLLAGNSPAWVTADLACQSAGVCLLPMPGFFSDAQLLHSLQAVGIAGILTDDPQRVTDLVDAQQATLVPFLGLTLIRLHNNLQLEGVRPELPQSTQKITFTSGSTGAPRGVCLSVSQQLRVAQALDTALQLPAPRHLCLLPLSTLLENIGGIYYPLLANGRVIAMDEATIGFSGATVVNMLAMLQALDTYRPSSIILLPQMLIGLVAALEDGWRAPAELQIAAVGGGKVAVGLLMRARELGLPVYEGYGLSETASVACLNYPGNDQHGSAGKPLAHVDVSVVDDELVIGGNTFLGYVGETASWGQEQVATGDLGKLDAAGFVHLSGRRKNLLISSLGRNISPEWVESELQLSPVIEQCIVFGDARPYCTALIAAADSDIADAEIQSIINVVNATLPDYACVQRWHRLHDVLNHSDGLYTANGRPRRAAIAASFAAVIDSLYREPARTVSL